MNDKLTSLEKLALILMLSLGVTFCPVLLLAAVGHVSWTTSITYVVGMIVAILGVILAEALRVEELS